MAVAAALAVAVALGLFLWGAGGERGGPVQRVSGPGGDGKPSGDRALGAAESPRTSVSSARSEVTGMAAGEGPPPADAAPGGARLVGWVHDTEGLGVEGLGLAVRRRSDGTRVARDTSRGFGEFELSIPGAFLDPDRATVLAVVLDAEASGVLLPNEVHLWAKRGQIEFLTLRVTGVILRIEGVVEDPRGIGVGGVDVRPFPGAAVRTSPDGRFALSAPHWGGPVVLSYGLPRATELTFERYTALRPNPEQERRRAILDVRLPWTPDVASLDLYVHDGTAPIPDARCRVAGMFGEHAVGPDGHARVAVPRSGSWALEVWSPDHLRQSVAVTEGTDELSVHLRPVFDFPLRTVDPEGRGIPGAKVTAGSSSMSPADLGVFFTDGEGRVEIPMRTRDLQLSAESPDGYQGRLLLERVEFPPPVATSLTLSPPVEWTGRVLDAAGSPVAGAIVSALREDLLEGHPKVTRSRSDGGYRVRGALDGRYTLRVSRKGYSELVETGLTRGGPKDLVLDEAGEVQLLLRATGSKDLAGRDALVTVGELRGNPEPLLLERLRLRVSPDGELTVPVARIAVGEECFLGVAFDPGWSGEAVVRVAPRGSNRAVDLAVD